jgi:hypothetical protein
MSTENAPMIATGEKVNGMDLIVVKSDKKLEVLNELQQAHLQKVKDFWLNYMFSCKQSIDRNKAIASIEWLYKLAGYEKPIMIFLDSPMACQYAVNFLKNIFEGAQVRAQVRAQVGDQVWDQVRAQVRAQVWAQVRAQVWDQVWAQIK